MLTLYNARQYSLVNRQDTGNILYNARQYSLVTRQDTGNTLYNARQYSLVTRQDTGKDVKRSNCGAISSIIFALG
jgi:hypothetical protein